MKARNEQLTTIQEITKTNKPKQIKEAANTTPIKPPQMALKSSLEALLQADPSTI